jgi:hypothetical protein
MHSPSPAALGHIAVLLLGSAIPICAARRHQAPSMPPSPVRCPAWVEDVTRMAFVTPGEVDEAAKAGVQVIQTNVVWPYFPLRRDGGGLSPEDTKRLRDLVANGRRHRMKVILGLPPFPPVALVKAHPDWRVPADAAGSILKVAPEEGNLGTRVGCNVGPWGDYLIEVCAELVQDYGLDGYSFDGNYHPPLCFCPWCKAAYRKDSGREIPPRADLDTLEYRQYLVWRGEKLEEHHRRLQERLKQVKPDAALITWTVNAGRYGHLLHSPRAMPSRMNRVFDMPMQEWWLDETNLGGSLVPSFGAAYLRAVAGDGPCAAEPYLMSRGNPYGTHSFPRHERIVRALLATTYGCLAPEAYGWAGHRATTADVFREVGRREPWITHSRRMPWAAMLVSEQTRQFYAYNDIAGRYLPHLFGAFRAAQEEHRALSLINDWDLTSTELPRYRVLVLPNAAALSDAQSAAVREYVRAGGGLVATCDTSLCDELGRRRPDFTLADVFGVHHRGTPKTAEVRRELDANFAVHLDESYWRERTGVATLTWKENPLLRDPRLEELVPGRSVLFRGPQLRVSEPETAAEVAARFQPEGSSEASLPAIVTRTFGKGRVVYLAAGLDAALWSYSFPYLRRMLTRAIDWAAGQPLPIAVEAPMCVQATFFTRPAAGGRQTVVHLFNGLDTGANHGLPAMDVPLREEAVLISGIRVRFTGPTPRRFHVEPGALKPVVRKEKGATVVEIPPLAVHAMLVGEP